MNVNRPPHRLWKPAAAVCLFLSGLSVAGYWAGLPTSSAQSQDRAAPASSEAFQHATALSEAFRAASDRVMPAVVSIQHEFAPKTVRREVRPRGDARRLPPEFEDLDPLFKRFFEDLPEMDQFEMPSVPRQSAGSGVIIDKTGVILTNNHVVAGGGKITVRLHDGRQYDAVEVQTDPNTDIAVVKIKAKESLPVASMGDSDRIQVGDWVLALGQPFGLTDTVTAGIISAKQRAVGITKHAEFLQTDAAINPGNSGGPLINLHGEIIGINTAISSNSGGFQGVGFAVPVNVAKWASSQLLKDGKVRRAYIGVGIQSVTKDLADQLGLETPGGAIVTEVVPDSPAAQAGLKPQDVIIGFAGQAVQSHPQLYALAGRSPIGSEQPLVVIRDGKRKELTVKMRELPSDLGLAGTEGEESQPAQSESASFENLGLQVAPIDGAVARQLRLKDANGVVITDVAEGSPAARAGLTASMVIVQVGRKPVRSVADFQAAMKDVSLEDGVLLLVRTDAGSRFVVIRESAG